MDKTTLRIKVPFIISMTILGVAALFLFIAGYLAFMPVNVVKANVQPYKVLTQSVKAGDNVIYVADVCKYKEVSSIAARSFVDENSVRYPIPKQQSNIAAGCGQNDVVIPTLPSYHAGKWYITLDIEYQVNFLRHQTYHFKTEVFTITNSNLGVQ